MGNARWSDADWHRHARVRSTQSREQIFTQRAGHDDLNPRNITVREARDSASNPESTPIIIAADETGSMGVLAETIIKRSLGEIMAAIYRDRPVPDPAICCMAVGDTYSDSSPLQVTQFESGVAPLTEQVAQLFLEGRGGGNGGESYPAVWWFAANKVASDSFAKRGRKGYIFTIGDESPHATLSRKAITEFLGGQAEQDVPIMDLLDQVQREWHVFHLMVKPVKDQPVAERWGALLGERAILVTDIERLGEGIVSVISLVEGASSQPSDAIVVRNTTAVVEAS